jgi:deazaflavin-dependent oxidoreductase (nitroreductase family)
VAKTLMRFLVWLYRVSGGRVAGTMFGAPLLLLTTTGRRTGNPWTNPLMYQPDGDGYIIVASNGGSDKHPGWWLNLRKNPEATIQIRKEVIPVTATRVTGAERERLFGVMVRAYKGYANYETKTTRKIPVVRLARR